LHQHSWPQQSTSTLGRQTNPSSRRPASPNRWLSLVIWGLALACISGCRPNQPTTTNDATRPGSHASSKTIVATSYPIQWVTQQIVGDAYQVSFPAGSSDHPDRWRPERNTIPEIQAADLIVCNGVAAPYAGWMKTVSLPSSKVVESASKGMSLADFISVEDIQIVHTHGPEGEHSHPTMVSRSWLEPAMLIKQSNCIAEQVCKLSPDDAVLFRANLAEVTSKLESIMPDAFPEQTPPVFAATPELKFLTRAAGVVDLHFNWNEKTMLKEVETDLASKAKDESIKIILFPQRLEALANQIKPELQKRKLTPIFIDMLDREDVERDVVNRLEDNFKLLRSAFLDTD